MERSWSRPFIGSCICALGLQAAAESASATSEGGPERARRACQCRPESSVPIAAQHAGIAIKKDHGEQERQEKHGVHDLGDEENPDERETRDEDAASGPGGSGQRASAQRSA